MCWNFTINYGSNITLKMGKLILQRTKSESWGTAMQSIYIGPFFAWAQRFLTKNRLSADGWDHNFCQSRLLPKQGTVTLTPRWGLLFILPENIILVGTTAEWEGQFWGITSHPLHSLESLPQKMFLFLFGCPCMGTHCQLGQQVQRASFTFAQPSPQMSFQLLYYIASFDKIIGYSDLMCFISW